MNSNNKLSNRKSNFELLRIIAMLLIIMGHISGQAFDSTRITESGKIFVTIMGSGSRIAVNLFLMIGIWFIGLLAWMFIKAQRQYKFSNDVTRDDALKVVAFVIVYFFASFAPSTFIGYSYQWLLIALACAHLSDSHIVRYNNPLPRNTALFKSV